MKDKLSKWLVIVTAVRDCVADMAERYPSEYQKLLSKYDDMIDEMYNENKRIN